MRKNRLLVAIFLVICALVLLPFQATAVALAFEIDSGYKAYPLGYDYRPLPVNGNDSRLNSAVYDGSQPNLRLIEVNRDHESVDVGIDRLPDAPPGNTQGYTAKKSIFKTLKNLRKDDDRLAQGNLKLLSIFDTGEGKLGRQSGINFSSDRLEDEKKEMPETLAMLLLGTGLIGLARIQRKHMKD